MFAGLNPDYLFLLYAEIPAPPPQPFDGAEGSTHAISHRLTPSVTPQPSRSPVIADVMHTDAASETTISTIPNLEEGEHRSAPAAVVKRKPPPPIKPKPRKKAGQDKEDIKDECASLRSCFLKSSLSFSIYFHVRVSISIAAVITSYIPSHNIGGYRISTYFAPFFHRTLDFIYNHTIFPFHTQYLQIYSIACPPLRRPVSLRNLRGRKILQSGSPRARGQRRMILAMVMMVMMVIIRMISQKSMIRLRERAIKKKRRRFIDCSIERKKERSL